MNAMLRAVDRLVRRHVRSLRTSRPHQRQRFLQNLAGALLVIIGVTACAGPSASPDTAHARGAVVERSIAAPSPITEFPLDVQGSGPFAITTGADRALWFTERGRGVLGRITVAGAMTTVKLPSSASRPLGIALTAGGYLYVTETQTNSVAVVTPNDTVTEYPIPSLRSRPTLIAGRPGRNDAWMAEFCTSKVALVAPTGVVQEVAIPVKGVKEPPRNEEGFPELPATMGPMGVAVAGDGTLWFTERVANKIGRLAPDGTLTEFALPTPYCSPSDIAPGPDGNMWFTEFTCGQVAKVNPNGAIQEYALPQRNCLPFGIAAGPDGRLWFTEVAGNRIGQITTGGSVSEVSIPTARSAPAFITAGPDGNMWFTEAQGNSIGRVTVQPTIADLYQATALGDSGRSQIATADFEPGIRWILNQSLPTRRNKDGASNLGPVSRTRIAL